MNVHTWLNGEALQSPGTGQHDATLVDRTNSFGDGVFETLFVNGGQVHLLQRHIDRLSASVLQLGLVESAEHSHFIDTVRQDINLAVAQIADSAEPLATYVLKLIISRGASLFGYGTKGLSIQRRVLLQRYAPGTTSACRLILCNMRLGSQPLLAGIKHCNRLEQVMARREVEAAGTEEGLMLDQLGNICEATAANIYIVEGDHLITPPLESCGIRGVMRGYILEEIAPQLGINVREETISPERLLGCDGLALSNAIQGLRLATDCQLENNKLVWSAHSVLINIKTELTKSMGYQ